MKTLLFGCMIAVLGLYPGQARAASPFFRSTPPPSPREVPVARTAAETQGANAMSVRSVVDENYLLRAGDRVSFSVAEDRKPPAELTVMASGELEIPNLGRFPAAGKNCRTLAAQLKPELEKRLYKSATVTIALNQAAASSLEGSSNIRVYFMGAVPARGAREFPPDGSITVSKAILIIGGFSDFASTNKVKLIRRMPDGKSQITVVKVGDLLKGKPGNDPVLQAEDMIEVPEKWINF